VRPKGTAQQLELRRSRAGALLKEGYPYQTVPRMVQCSISSLVPWMQSFRRKGKAGYSTEMWTSWRVAEQIHWHWGIAYHRGHAWKILIGLGWSCQKPERRAIQREVKNPFSFSVSM